MVLRCLGLAMLVVLSANTAADSVCQFASTFTVANSYATPFGLISSDTGNFQWGATGKCGNYGSYVEHAQRFNGGRDNTIVGIYYRLPLSNGFSTRLALDHLDVNDLFETPRARWRLSYSGEVNASVEAFYFLNSQDQRLLMWSIADSVPIVAAGQLQWSIGGSFNTGFSLADRYYAQVGYRHRINDQWSWRTLYNYQHQPMQNNLVQFDVAYQF